MVQSSSRLRWSFSRTDVPCSCGRNGGVEVVEMSMTTATQTVTVLRKMHVANGLPEQLVSDNGPQFVSEEFASFCQFNGIKPPLLKWISGDVHTVQLPWVSLRRMDCRSHTDWPVFSSCTMPLLRELQPFHHQFCVVHGMFPTYSLGLTVPPIMVIDFGLAGHSRPWMQRCMALGTSLSQLLQLTI